MKFKTTLRELKEGYNYIISTGYCDLQSLLCYENPVAYNAGVYGWNFDVYDINGVAICTGYRSMPSKNTNAPYTLIKEYEENIEGKTAEEKRALLIEFVNNCMNK